MKWNKYCTIYIYIIEIFIIAIYFLWFVLSFVVNIRENTKCLNNYKGKFKAQRRAK